MTVAKSLQRLNPEFRDSFIPGGNNSGEERKPLAINFIFLFSSVSFFFQTEFQLRLLFATRILRKIDFNAMR